MHLAAGPPQDLHRFTRKRASLDGQSGIRDALNPGMDQQTLETFRSTLLQRHHSLVVRRQHALAAEDDLLAEPELDPEDTAAVGSAAALLDSLGETERLALIRVEAALDRIQQGG